MKLRRLLSATLALLLVVSILPLGAFAEGDFIGENEKLPQNDHFIAQNLGTITDNGTPDGSNEDIEVRANGGTITNNYAGVGINSGSGLVVNNKSGGTVSINMGDGTIETNEGTVGTKKADGTVNTNTGNFATVETNKGDILINHEDGIVGAYTDTTKTTPDTSKGNYGTVELNEGIVLINQEGGTVETNAQGGVIDVNNGVVGEIEDGEFIFRDGIDNGNCGTINTNNGQISINREDATIGTNNDQICKNYGNIGTNSGYVDWNYGTVDTNTIDGFVWNEPDANGVTGEVKTNYGTVYTTTDVNTGDYEIQYGVQVQNTDGGAGTKLLQALETEILKLADLFKRDGYELVGYEDITPNSDKENPDGGDYPDEEIPDGDIPAELSLNDDPDIPELSATDFQAKRPSILSLIWKSITKPASSGGSGDAGPAVLTRLSADKARVGTLIRCGNLIFKIIEVNDDSIRVATVCMLSQQNQKDMMGFLKQYLSAAQIDKFIGQPELLEEDEIAEFFGDNRAHIAFYAAKDLFEKN